jgi:hypothetical protein
VPEALSHLRSLRDVTDLNFPACSAAAAGRPAESAADASVTARYTCPITRLSLNGHNRFCTVWGLGTVLAQRCFDELPEAALHEAVGGAFVADDVVLLCPSEAERRVARTALLARTAKRRRERRSAKGKVKGKEKGKVKGKGKGKGKGKRRRTGSAEREAGSLDDASPPVGGKRRKQKPRGSTQRAATSAGLAKMLGAGRHEEIAQEAAAASEAESARSNTYKSLFHSDGRAIDKEGLFIRNATHRYTLG